MSINGTVSTAGSTVINVDAGATITFQWAPGVDVVFSRGVTDTDRTAIALRSPNGTLKYLLIADDNTVTASATAP